MATATDAPVSHTRATVHPDKAAAVAEIAEAFRASAAAVLTEYRGLTVKQISQLRTALGADTDYTVVKNTLTRIAARDAGLTGLEDLLQGPTAVAFIKGEPVDAAKALRDFARTHPVLIVKGGVMDGQALSPDEIRQLADLESREVLLAKMAGALLASLSNAVYLFNAPLAQAARVVGALQAKAEADPSVLAGGAGEAPSASDTASEPDAGSTPADSQPADSQPAAEAVAPEPAASGEAVEPEPAAEPAGSEVLDTTLEPSSDEVPATTDDEAASPA